MPLNDEQRKFYENNLAVIREEVDTLTAQIEEELAKVRDKIMELQNEKKAALEMYAATCNRLGRPNDLEDEEEATVAEAG